MTNNGSHRRHLHLPHLSNRHRDGDGQSVSPGWYDDPTGRFEQRYWNGEEWTTEVIRLTGMVVSRRPRRDTSGKA